MLRRAQHDNTSVTLSLSKGELTHKNDNADTNRMAEDAKV